MERMREVWDQPGVIPPLDARLAVVAAVAKDLRSLGPANFLYSDGDALFAHGDRRKHAPTGKVQPPGLVFLERLCRRSEPGLDANGVSVEGADQAITLIASVPLSDDPWQPLRQGEVVAISKGNVLARRSGTTAGVEGLDQL
jgi:glutamine amidotransferase